MIREIERIGQSDSRDPQDGAQSRDLLRDLVHLLTVEESILEEM